jgi:RNA polymerase sigma factor (sigma-70 family)
MVSSIDPIAGSDRSGLVAVFMEHRPSLLRLLAARQAAPDEAEDILQELFLKLKSDGSAPVAEPRAYLYRAVENLLIDRRRSSSRRAVREDAWTVLRATGAVETDDGPSIERTLIAREELETVTNAIAQLPERTVHALRRFRIDGASQREIAEEIGISLSAVEKHLQKAYKALIEIRSAIDADLPAPRRSTLESEL